MEKRNQVKLRILDVLRHQAKPTTTDYVSYKTKLAWGTCKSALLELALSHQIIAVETTRGFVFFIANKTKELEV
jgi:hypothetical protein